MAVTTYIVDTAGPAQVTPVFLLSGSVAVNLNPGDITIGSVEVVDNVTGLRAQIEFADTPKAPTVNTLLVQSVDIAGGVVSASDVADIKTNTAATASAVSTGNSSLSTVVTNTDNTVVAIDEQTVVLKAILNEQGTENLAPTNAILTVVMNGQGTLATSAAQAAQEATLTAILNGQGTLATHTDAQALNSSVGAGNAILEVVMNNEGTLATHTDATAINSSVGAGNSVLTVVMNNEGTLATHADVQAINSTIVASNTILTVIMNDQGTIGSTLGATALGQAVLNAQLASVTQTYGLTGTRAAASFSTTLRLDPNDPTADAFGRLRVSEPAYRFDGQLTYNIPPEIWDTVWTSTGTVSYDSTNRMAKITCAANAVSTMQSHYYAPYTPGRSQLIYSSFIFGTTPPIGVARRVGYYDGSNGVYLEQNFFNVTLNVASTTGNGLESVAQSSWNVDRFDGTGPSGVTLDLSKVQILVIYLQMLYSGRVSVGFNVNGNIFIAHQFNHANILSLPYIAQASLPVHYSVRSTGTNTASMNSICASVISEGGNELPDIPGRTFSASSGVGQTINSRRPLLSIMPAKFFNGQNDNALIVPINISAGVTTSNIAFIELVRNATINGAAWSAVDSGNSVALFDTAGTTVTGGSTIYSTYVAAGGNIAIDINPHTVSRFICAYSQLVGTADALTLVASPVSSNPNIAVALNWKETR